MIPHATTAFFFSLFFFSFRSHVPRSPVVAPAQVQPSLRRVGGVHLRVWIGQRSCASSCSGLYPRRLTFLCPLLPRMMSTSSRRHECQIHTATFVALPQYVSPFIDAYLIVNNVSAGHVILRHSARVIVTCTQLPAAAIQLRLLISERKVICMGAR